MFCTTLKTEGDVPTLTGNPHCLAWFEQSATGLEAAAGLSIQELMPAHVVCEMEETFPMLLGGHG